ncbi:MAG TPA: NAD(P)H-binding protein [Steroidobacteraceae bacterium]|nr:NAD(P)H-binding protein [Steroidobacteraceae bacterium]
MNGISRRLAVSMVAGALALTLVAGGVAAQEKAAKPLNIVVYGGSGSIGSRIVNEAAARGHKVTVVDKSPKAEIAPAGVTVVTGDALDPKDILKNIANADVMVSSVIVRPAPTPDFALRIAKAEVEALRQQAGPKKTRLMIVGGASSLYNADGKRIIDTFPGGRNNGEVGAAVEALDWLRAEVKDSVSWTYFSPAGNIRPGERTGKFRLGGEQLVTDAQGRSAISMEDFAVAMLDEIEKPQYINNRFTVGY